MAQDGDRSQPSCGRRVSGPERTLAFAASWVRPGSAHPSFPPTGQPSPAPVSVKPRYSQFRLIAIAAIRTVPNRPAASWSDLCWSIMRREAHQQV